MHVTEDIPETPAYIEGRLNNFRALWTSKRQRSSNIIFQDLFGMDLTVAYADESKEPYQILEDDDSFSGECRGVQAICGFSLQVL